MNSEVIQTLGGLGLFLLGMAIMTGALRALADERLRNLLSLTVDNPFKGALTGAFSTAVLQSSSATTIAAVGFVGAGLLTFPESLGVIFGANIGTTITGWLVALIGFKLNLGQTLLPLILIGVLLRLTGSSRLEQIGMAISGLGLVFVGIGLLQEGMAGLNGILTPQQFPPDTIPGRVLLVLIGVIITIITQSSSAGVATALTAVHTDTISLNQAAAMVIGMDIGTTATAAMATIGGNVPARRTGFAHVIYNAFTGLGAFLLLTPYMLLVENLLPGVRIAEPELVLVGFHTLFNLLGVIVVLPFTNQFSNMIVRLIPERGNPLTKQLDRSLMSEPVVAITAVGNSLWEVTMALLNELQRHLRDIDADVNAPLLNEVSDAIEKNNHYLEELATRFQPSGQIHDYISCMHILDHLRRIERRVREQKRLNRCRDDKGLAEMADQLAVLVENLKKFSYPIRQEQVDLYHSLNSELKNDMKKYRAAIVGESSQTTLTTSEALRRMDTARSLRRIGYHLWRITHHFAKSHENDPPS